MGYLQALTIQIINFGTLQTGEDNNEFFCDCAQGANAMISEASLSEKNRGERVTSLAK